MNSNKELKKNNNNNKNTMYVYLQNVSFISNISNRTLNTVR